MLKSLKLENFRGFESFALQQLGRINLLVGSNNSGKTSILEAIHLLSSRANLITLKDQMLLRGEFSIPDEQEESYTLDAQNFFHNYTISEATRIEILGQHEDNLESRLRIVPMEQSLSNSFYVHSKAEKSEFIVPQRDLIENQAFITNEKFWFLHFAWGMPADLTNGSVDLVGIRLSPTYAIYEQELRAYISEKIRSTNHAFFIRSSSLTPHEMVEIFNRIVLTPDEELVNNALQVIDPTVQRIASMGMNINKNRNAHSNFFVLKSDINQRVPIGNMGEGMWHMLGLALGLVNAKGGILLVDDIDTGLHFSTMVGMWKMIWEMSKRLNVQVFATTHSRDCWESLSEIARSQDAAEQGITIHRIEKDKQRSVVFNERKIVIAADQDIEVR